VLYINCDKPSVLTIFILPCRVSFQLFKLLSVFSNLRIFSFKVQGTDRFLRPFEVLWCTDDDLFYFSRHPATDECLNLHSSSSRFDTEAWSLTNTVLSSVNCESFFFFANVKAFDKDIVLQSPCEKFNTDHKKKTRQRASFPNASIELEKG